MHLYSHRMPAEDTQAAGALKPSSPTLASHKDPADTPAPVDDVTPAAHPPTNGMETPHTPISVQGEDGLTEPDSTIDAQTVAVASLSADASPAVDRSDMPSLDERIVVPAPEQVADAEKSLQMALPVGNSSMSQASLGSMKDVPLDSSPPPPPLPKLPEKDIPRRPITSSPAPLASPAPRESRQSSTTIAHGQHTVSVVHIMTALDTIAASKEGKRGPLKDSVQKARQLVLEGSVGDHREVFEPLRLACETRNEKLMISSLDCIQKLISHSFLTDNNTPESHYISPPPSPTASTVNQATSLADLVTLTITSAYTETTPDAVSLQIVKALLSLVLSTTLIVHHSALLKAVRTVYNVFLLSQDSTNQMVAQGALSQMVNHVFMRCKTAGPSITPSMVPSSRRASAHIPNGSVVVPIEPRDQVSSPPSSPPPTEQEVAATNSSGTPAPVEPVLEQVTSPMTYVARRKFMCVAAHSSIQ